MTKMQWLYYARIRFILAANRTRGIFLWGSRSTEVDRDLIISRLIIAFHMIICWALVNGGTRELNFLFAILYHVVCSDHYVVEPGCINSSCFQISYCFHFEIVKRL